MLKITHTQKKCVQSFPRRQFFQFAILDLTLDDKFGLYNLVSSVSSVQIFFSSHLINGQENEAMWIRKSEFGHKKWSHLQIELAPHHTFLILIRLYKSLSLPHTHGPCPTTIQWNRHVHFKIENLLFLKSKRDHWGQPQVKFWNRFMYLTPPTVSFLPFPL